MAIAESPYGSRLRAVFIDIAIVGRNRCCKLSINGDNV